MRHSSIALEHQKADDESLATALLAGEPTAATLAWRRLSPMVMRLLQRTRAREIDSQDLHQEIFLRFFARITELRNPAALRPFLFGICLGVTQNAQRRQRIRRLVCSMRDDALERRGISAPADSDAREALSRLCRILESVAPAERELFVSRHVHKLEMPDIASRQGWSLAVTKRRVAMMNRRLSLATLADPALTEYARGFFTRCGRQSRAVG
ncbi:MAG: sigma-70 family RNA polymerase sigma factor [Pseudomonadota bacterium]